MEIPEKLKRSYAPNDTENRIYEMWEQSGFFNPDNLPARHTKSWTTIMPPPNANGRLHAGHGLDMTLKDVMTRYKRMQGFKTLFLPGADHAGFETQIVYEKKLEKEGRSRFQMKPADLYKEILDFTLENKKFMESDVRKLGTSCDWSREKFTLDADVITQVHATFRKMYDDGLIYRGGRIVNWCPKHQTSLSEVETESVEQKGIFYYFQYGPFVIGTARPETKFGDKYVVVHPDDERYAQFKHGQKFTVEWINGQIEATLLKDAVIDMAMGTGAMTITPWHSQVDFELAEKYNLDREQIIDERGKLLPIAGEFAGMKIEEAREKIVEKLEKKGLLVKKDEQYMHAVKTCYKCGRTIEPQIKKQWFVKMKPLAEMAITAVRDGNVKFLTPQFEKVFFHWMENPIDWNISRQIVWGIPIPAWFRNQGTENETFVVSEAKPDGEGWEKDMDTFDTWFSSGQWPLVTLGFPDSPDFKEFYPTQVMETGRDLVFKWVPRMIMFGMYLAKKEPFETVYFHGMVNDEHRQKMSKSKGNVLSPVDLVEEFSADALRMALVVGNPPGADMALSKDKVKAYSKFTNKLWNIARFVLENSQGSTLTPNTQGQTLNSEHQKYIDELNALVAEITREMDEYKFYLVSEKLYHYIWHTFADKIIEELKPAIKGTDEALKLSALFTINYLLFTSLKLLHPFMPFITEEIWQLMHNGNPDKPLIIESWPTQA